MGLAGVAADQLVQPQEGFLVVAGRAQLLHRPIEPGDQLDAGAIGHLTLHGLAEARGPACSCPVIRCKNTGQGSNDDGQEQPGYFVEGVGEHWKNQPFQVSTSDMAAY